MLDRNTKEETGSRAASGSRRSRLVGHAINAVIPYVMKDWRSRRAFRDATKALPSGTVYHEPNYVLQPFAGPAVATVHDLSVYHYPQFHPKARVRHMERYLPRSVETAAHVITDSSLVRRELLERFLLDPDRVSVIPLGVSEDFRPVSHSERMPVLNKYGLVDGSYLFCVSTFEPRKNLAGLVEAFARLPDRLRKEVPLVLVGSDGWLNGDLARTLRKYEERGEVIRLGYVPGRHLPALYSGTRIFVFPSFYEGFGLPVLEAMACGAPVITSRGTAMEEVTGNCAELVDPVDVDSLTELMACLVDDSAKRSQLSTAGRRQAAEFTWSKCAARHIEVFRSVSDAVTV